MGGFKKPRSSCLIDINWTGGQPFGESCNAQGQEAKVRLDCVRVCVYVCVVQNVPLHGEEDWALIKVPLIGSWRPQLSVSQLASDDAASAVGH